MGAPPWNEYTRSKEQVCTHAVMSEWFLSCEEKIDVSEQTSQGPRALFLTFVFSMVSCFCMCLTYLIILYIGCVDIELEIHIL